LHAFCASALEILGRVRFLCPLFIDGHARVFCFECGVLSNFTIEWQRHADLVAARPQCTRQRIHYVNQCAGPLQRRPFRADHEDSHCVRPPSPKPYSCFTHSSASSLVRNVPSSCPVSTPSSISLNFVPGFTPTST